MKKTGLLARITVMVLVFAILTTAYAEIIPSYGMGQIGLQATVLCNELTLREKPSSSAKAIKTLKFRDLIIVTEEKDGWAYCVLGDSEDALAGWVNSEFIFIDPSWYLTEGKTPVYAWNDLNAPKVALLEKNTQLFEIDTCLPILKNEGEWLLVSLRGATGWIHLSGTDLAAWQGED